MHAPYGTLILLQTRPHWSLFNNVQRVGHVGVVGLPCRIGGVNLQMIAYMSYVGLPSHHVVIT